MTDATKIDRDALMEAIGSALGDALLCSRVWEAWQHKTMTEDDFSPAAEDDDYVAGFADAVITHLSTLPVEPEVEWEYGVGLVTHDGRVVADDEDQLTEDIEEARDWVAECIDSGTFSNAILARRAMSSRSWEVVPNE